MSDEKQLTKIKTVLTLIDGGKPPGEDFVDQIFGAGGYLSKQFVGYQPRPGQIRLARAIDQGIREGRHVIAEGPTGTGKSLAYSAPALIHAVKAGKVIGIVTANTNLQRQIYEKDLADLKAAVPWPFRYAIRKGMGRYLCVRDLYAEEYQELRPKLDDAQIKMLEATIDWAWQSETGDFEESPGPDKLIWSKFSTDREECDGMKCKHIETCHVAAAKERAKGAHITVTNYHLFYTQLLAPNAKVLPEFDVVIFDEAHRAADIARDFFGEKLKWGAVYRVIKGIDQVKIRSFVKRGKDLKVAVMNSALALWKEMGRLVRSQKSILETGDLESEEFEIELSKLCNFYEDVSNAIAGLDLTCQFCLHLHYISDKGLKPVIEGKNARFFCQNIGCKKLNHRQIGFIPDDMLTLYESCQRLASRTADILRMLTEFRLCPGKGMVYFIEGTGDTKKLVPDVRLKSSPVDVSGFLRMAAFEKYPTIVQTSATLAVAGGNSDFAHQRSEVGLSKADNLIELTVESPFNWSERAMLVIPRSMPEYEFGNEDWDTAVLKHVHKTIQIVRGRTLGLFTSRRMMEKTRDYLRKKGDWRILCQYEKTNRQLADEFQSDVNSVLLGTTSFSEGVSIEGEACSCVIMDKIPFVPKDNPVVHGLAKMYKEQGSRKDVFNNHMLPKAIIDFKQRVGRLIRTVDDHGVAVCLDRRLLTKKYRFKFINSLPKMRLTDSLDDIGPFLERFNKK